MEKLERYLNVLYSVIVWAAILLFIKRNKIKSLYPVGIIAIVAMILQESFLVSLNLHIFVNPFIPVLLNNVPLFHFVFAAGSGIFMMNFMKKEPYKKPIVILIFAFITTLFSFVSDKLGCCHLLGNFTIMQNFYQNFLVLSFLTLISEAFFYDRIYTEIPNRAGGN